MGSAAYQNPTISINQNVGNVTDSYKNVWNNCDISVSDAESQILEWLSPMEPRKRHQDVREDRLGGVGDWILETSEFREWFANEDEAVHPLLFCYGDPGAGKTYLSSLVIDTLCDTIGGDNVAVACVYGDFRAHKEQSATGVLAALLKQLVVGAGQVQEEITEAFARSKREVGGRALRLPEIHVMLIKSILSLRRGFICIDAFDEFAPKHQSEIWDSLQRIVRECPNLRLFITGRPHIRGEVKTYFPGYPDLPAIKPTEQEIREYLTMRLKNDLEADAMDMELRADILRIIPDKISETFLLVSLTIDAVLQDATIHQRRQTLLKAANGSGLSDAYSTTLDRIKEQSGNRARLGMEALMWVSCSERPLKAEELCHALAVEVGATDLNAHNVPSVGALMSSTLGLVTIDKHASTLRPVHFTLQEHLAAHPGFFTTSHSLIAEVCLTYLNFESIRKLSAPPTTISSTMPLLNYSSCYWGAHARRKATESVKSQALQLLAEYENHISSKVLLLAGDVNFLPRWGRYRGICPDPTGFTGLHCAAYMGITETGRAMLNMERWDLNGRDANGATPLIWAAEYGNSAFTKVLLEQGEVDPTLSDKRGKAALTHAARAGHQEVVKLLVERGDVNPDWLDEHGRTPVSYAAESGSESVVSILLEQGGVNPGLPDVDGRTPLSYGAESASEDVVKLLLDRRDVSPDPPDGCGRTPLSYAAGSGHEGVVKILMQRTDVNPSAADGGGRTSLSYAAGSGHGGVAELLMQQTDVNPDSEDRDGRTPLSYAAEYGCEGMVKLLLKREDVNPDLSNKCGQTALSYAAGSGRVSVAKLLLERGNVNSDSPDSRGRTPLSYAAGSGREDVVKLLLEQRDVNPDSPDRRGRTPLSYAAWSGCESVVELLLGRGNVDTDLPDKCGRTPLSYAAGSGHGGVVEILLQLGDVNPNSLDKYGQTPLTRAAGLGSTRVVGLLSEPRAFSHITWQNNGVLQQISPPVLGAQRAAESGQVLQSGGVIHYMREEIMEGIPPPRPDVPPWDQPRANPASSAPILTPAPDCAILKSFIRVGVLVGASCFGFLCLIVFLFLYVSFFSSSFAMHISVRHFIGGDVLYYCSGRGGCKLVDVG